MSNKVIVAKLDALASLIKRSSEIAEIANVSLDELHASIGHACDEATERLVGLMPINIEDYERDLGDWKVAWKDRREILIGYCQEALGNVAARRKKEALAAYGKRLLFECHRAGLGGKWKGQLPAAGAKPAKFVDDPEAHRLLKRWGSFSKEAFKADLQETDPQLIARAAQALGLKVGLKAKTFPGRLHTAATRFANNTTLF